MSIHRSPEASADENTVFDVLSNFHKTSKSAGAYWASAFSPEDIKELAKWCVLFRFKPGERVHLSPAQERLLFPVDKTKTLACSFTVAAASNLSGRSTSRRGGTRNSTSRMRRHPSNSVPDKLAVVIYGNPTDMIIHEKKNFQVLATTELQDAGPLVTNFQATLQLTLPVWMPPILPACLPAVLSSGRACCIASHLLASGSLAASVTACL